MMRVTLVLTAILLVAAPAAALAAPAAPDLGWEVPNLWDHLGAAVPAETDPQEIAPTPAVAPDELGGTPSLPPASPQTVAPVTATGLALSALLAKFVGVFYSRIPGARVLDHPTRKSLLDLVRGNPGITMEEARARLAVGSGTMVHHVARLQSEGMLVSEKGHGRRLYAAGAVPPAERAKRAVLAGDTTQRIADYVAANPGASQKDVCGGLGIAPSVASKHFAKLKRAGLVTELREWRNVRYFPAGAAHPLLRDAGPGFASG